MMLYYIQVPRVLQILQHLYGPSKLHVFIPSLSIEISLTINL
jgi:hypothetical protein